MLRYAFKTSSISIDDDEALPNLHSSTFLAFLPYLFESPNGPNSVDMSWHTFPKWGKCTNCKNVSAWKNCIFLVKTCHKMKANKLILSGREQKNPFGDWVKLYDWFVCLLGKSLESWAAEIERSGLSSRFISLFTTFLQQEKRFIVKLCFCRLTCLECQKKNHGDPKPVFPLGHPHTSSETNYFQRPTSCKDRSTKNN